MNWKALAAAGAAIVLAVPVGIHAEVVAGVRLSPTLQFDGEDLVLASCGVRDTLWIDHYAVGLYVPRGTRATSAVQDAKASKALVVRILNAEHFPGRVPEKWREPLQDSLTAAAFARVSDAFRKLRQGDTLLYAYSPDSGLTMAVNGETVVNAGHAVIDALLRAWQRGEDPEKLGKLLQGHDC